MKVRLNMETKSDLRDLWWRPKPH